MNALRSAFGLTLALALCAASAPVRAGQSDATSNRVQATKSMVDLKADILVGRTRLAGVGTVDFHAQREGQRVVVWAKDAQGQVIGKAETVLGLSETPIYVRGASGITSATIIWPKLSSQGSPTSTYPASAAEK